jgi:hypothetical protein
MQTQPSHGITELTLSRTLSRTKPEMDSGSGQGLSFVHPAGNP